MAARRVRITRAGWIAIAVAGALVVAGLAVPLVLLRGPADCTVRVSGRVVELDQDDAERVTTAAAGAVRGRLGAPAVAAALGLPAADAAAVTAAVSGRVEAALSCRAGGASTSEPDRLDRRGLTARAAAVRADLRTRFGALPMGGFAPGGVSSGHMPGSAHYDGRAIDVFFRPVSDAARTRGWALAHYLVAHAERLAIDTVIFDGRIWTARRGDEEWRRYRVDVTGRSRAAARVLEHRDHVHVDVAD